MNTARTLPSEAIRNRLLRLYQKRPILRAIGPYPPIPSQETAKMGPRYPEALEYSLARYCPGRPLLHAQASPWKSSAGTLVLNPSMRGGADSLSARKACTSIMFPSRD